MIEVNRNFRKNSADMDVEINTVIIIKFLTPFFRIYMLAEKIQVNNIF
jgi:hypothetical protein